MWNTFGGYKFPGALAGKTMFRPNQANTWDTSDTTLAQHIHQVSAMWPGFHVSDCHALSMEMSHELRFSRFAKQWCPSALPYLTRRCSAVRNKLIPFYPMLFFVSSLQMSFSVLFVARCILSSISRKRTADGRLGTVRPAMRRCVFLFELGNKALKSRAQPSQFQLLGFLHRCLRHSSSFFVQVTSAQPLAEAHSDRSCGVRTMGTPAFLLLSEWVLMGGGFSRCPWTRKAIMLWVMIVANESWMRYWPAIE